MEIREVALLAVEQAFKAIFQNTPEQEPLTATGLSLGRQRAKDFFKSNPQNQFLHVHTQHVQMSI